MTTRSPLPCHARLGLSLLLISTAHAQVPGQSIPTLPTVAVTQSPQGFDATIGKETLHLVVCSDSLLHITTRPNDTAIHHPQPWLLPEDQSCKGAPFQFAQDEKAATLKTAKLTASISLARGNLTFATPDNKPLLRERDSVPRTYDPVTLNGDATFHVVDRFWPDATEAFYGLGQHQSGMFNYRGSTVELGQNNTDVAIPFLLSTKGYGVVWNTAAYTYVDNRFPLELSFDSIAGDGVDYFVLYGPEIDDIIHQYRYRTEHIPMDVMVQDWFWWKREGDPIFNDNYHDVPADLKKLHDQHVHTMISTWGLIDPTSDTYKKLDSEKLFVPNARVYDSSSPRARDIYWESLPGKLFAQGWDSFWLDSAEPEEYWPHSGDAVLRDKQLAIGNGALYTNIYPFLHNEGIQQNWRKTTDQKRTFLLTRCAFIGQQRVGATVWSGDVYSSFWALSHQVPAGLNFALSVMPYIYSLAWKVSSDDYTIQRPLVMDFRDEPFTWNIGDQFMFGPAILVSPVTEPKATERRVYLPKDTTWYDFWSGQKNQGGVHLQAAAPLNRIPLYVRAGSILPLGPPEQYASEKVNGPIELRVYTGANGNFSLYQDEGDNYNYETGHHATIPITWSQSDNTLTIAPRTGTYAGMPEEITFNIVWVKPNHGTGGAVEQRTDNTLIYRGSEIK